jgi:hypothetical protein
VIAVVDAHGEVTRFLTALDADSAARAVRAILW